jgi:hypothetical protein
MYMLTGCYREAPCNTIRAWTIGLLLTTIACSINMLFSLRNPSISITTYVVQLVAYPLGRGWDLVCRHTLRLLVLTLPTNYTTFCLDNAKKDL